MVDQLHFHCPACQQPTKAPIGQVGQMTRCGVCGQMIVVPGTPVPSVWPTPPPLLAAIPVETASPIAAAPIAPPSPYPDDPINIDLRAGVPGLRRSASYRVTEKRVGIAHRPSTTFGHAFGGSFGCVFGFYMAVLAATIVFAVVAAVINFAT